MKNAVNINNESPLVTDIIKDKLRRVADKNLRAKFAFRLISFQIKNNLITNNINKPNNFIEIDINDVDSIDTFLAYDLVKVQDLERSQNRQLDQSVPKPILFHIL